jgi:hypothetical protein
MRERVKTSIMHRNFAPIWKNCQRGKTFNSAGRSLFNFQSAQSE